MKIKPESKPEQTYITNIYSKRDLKLDSQTAWFHSELDPFASLISIQTQITIANLH